MNNMDAHGVNLGNPDYCATRPYRGRYRNLLLVYVEGIELTDPAR